MVASKERGSRQLASTVPVVAGTNSNSQNNRMKIMNVLGLGLLIVMLKFLVPKIFSGFENTLLVFFDTAQHLLGSGSTYPFTAGYLPKY